MSVKAIVDGGEQCAFAAGAAVEHGLREVGGSGFSLGSGNADDFQLVLRVPIECRGQQTHSFARVIHDESRSFVAAEKSFSATYAARPRSSMHRDIPL